MKLQKGRHPRTGALLPPPVRPDGSRPAEVGTYSNLSVYRSGAGHEVPVASSWGSAEGTVRVRIEPTGKSTRVKMEERLLRVRAKEAAAKAAEYTRGSVRRRLSTKGPESRMCVPGHP